MYRHFQTSRQTSLYAGMLVLLASMTEQMPEFILHDFEPAYLQMYRRGKLGERVERAFEEMNDRKQRMIT